MTSWLTNARAAAVRPQKPKHLDALACYIKKQKTTAELAAYVQGRAGR